MSNRGQLLKILTDRKAPRERVIQAAASLCSSTEQPLSTASSGNDPGPAPQCGGGAARPKTQQGDSRDLTTIFSAYHRVDADWQLGVMALHEIEAKNKRQTNLIALNALLKLLPLAPALRLAQQRMGLDLGGGARRGGVGASRNQAPDSPEFRADGGLHARGTLSPDFAFRAGAISQPGKASRSRTVDARAASSSSSPQSASPSSILQPPDKFTYTILLQKVAQKNRESNIQQRGWAAKSSLSSSGHTTLPIKPHELAAALLDDMAERNKRSCEKICDMQVLTTAVRCCKGEQWTECVEKIVVKHAKNPKKWDAHFAAAVLDVLAKGAAAALDHDATSAGDLILERSRSCKGSLFSTEKVPHDSGKESDSASDEEGRTRLSLRDVAAEVYAAAQTAGVVNQIVRNAYLKFLAATQDWIACLDFFAKAFFSGSTGTAGTTAADEVSFCTAVSGLPPSEWILALNLVQKLEETGKSLKPGIAFAVLHLLERAVFEQRCGVEEESGVHPLEYVLGRGDSLNRRVERTPAGVRLCTTILPSRFLTTADRKVVVEDAGDEGGENIPPPQVVALPASTTPLIIGRKLITGLFAPARMGWNEPIFRAAFCLLLRDPKKGGGASLSHPDWSFAVQLWRSRDAASVFGNCVFQELRHFAAHDGVAKRLLAEQSEGRSSSGSGGSGGGGSGPGRSAADRSQLNQQGADEGRVLYQLDLHGKRSFEDAHSPETACVGVFCALVDLGAEKRKLRGSFAVRIVCGRGDYRLRNSVARFFEGLGDPKKQTVPVSPALQLASAEVMRDQGSLLLRLRCVV